MSITCSECVFVDLNIQHEKRVRRDIFSFVASSILQHLSTLSNKWLEFRKTNYWKYNMCFDFLCNVCL